MRHRECMRHLVYMRTPVRVGVADGAIDVTSTVVGKVSELGHGEVSLTLRSHAPEACAKRASFRLWGAVRTGLPRDPGVHPFIEVRDLEAALLVLSFTSNWRTS